MKIGIIGAEGQLGYDLMSIFGSSALGFDIKDLDIRKFDKCQKLLKDLDLVINCAAYVKVDDCEDNWQEALGVNALGAKNVALVCKQINAKLMYISTDFVFDGEKKDCYQEEDVPNPINVYGASKYLGEIFVRNCLGQHYIVRTSSLYGIKGAKGKKENFIDTIAKSNKQGKCLEIVDDIYMSPTYTKDLAVMIGEIIESDLPFGIYHASNKGSCSWFEFAKNILKLLGMDGQIKPVKSKDFDGKARRPKYTVLANTKVESSGLKMRTWEKALEEFISERSKIC